MSPYSTVLTRHAGPASQLLKAIANPHRLMILSQLKMMGSSNVTQLLANLDISQSALSQHLSLMKSNHIVKTRRQGNTIYYQIADDIVHQILTVLDDKFSRISY